MAATAPPGISRVGDTRRRVPFTKMHGLRNDYVYLDGWLPEIEAFVPAAACTSALQDAAALISEADPAGAALSALALRVSPRDGSGVGSDGLVWIGPHGASGGAAMRMFNSDGSEARMCGNGLRCAARIAAGHLGVTADEPFTVLTLAGPMTVRVHGVPSEDGETTVVFPCPVVGAPESIALEGNGADTVTVVGVPVSMGNPHFVILCDANALAPALARIPAGMHQELRSQHGGESPSAEWADTVRRIGSALEHHPRFAPHRTNVEFVRRVTHDFTSDVEGREGTRSTTVASPTLLQWTWERGAGETFACGTGACAVAAAALRHGWVAAGNGSVAVQLKGGRIDVSWDAQAPGSTLTMRGGATYVFEGLLVL